jgi:hypothetical protein
LIALFCAFPHLFYFFFGISARFCASRCAAFCFFGSPLFSEVFLIFASRQSPQHSSVHGDPAHPASFRVPVVARVLEAVCIAPPHPEPKVSPVSVEARDAAFGAGFGAGFGIGFTFAGHTAETAFDGAVSLDAGFGGAAGGDSAIGSSSVT